jgi:hypothetical protein
MEATFQAPEGMTNVVHLRLECLERVKSDEDKPLTLRERLTVAALLAVHAGSDSGLLIDAMHDFEDSLLPRYTVLSGWLAPWGPVSKHPNAIIKVARYLMGEFPEAEKLVAWERVQQRYGDV